MRPLRALRELRKSYGITLRDVLRSAADLKQDGISLANCDCDEAAELLLGGLLKDPVLTARLVDAGWDFDWTKLIELLLKLLPLILPLFL